LKSSLNTGDWRFYKSS